MPRIKTEGKGGGNYKDTNGGSNYSSEQTLLKFVTLTVIPKPTVMTRGVFGAFTAAPPQGLILSADSWKRAGFSAMAALLLSRGCLSTLPAPARAALAGNPSGRICPSAPLSQRLALSKSSRSTGYTFTQTALMILLHPKAIKLPWTCGVDRYFDHCLAIFLPVEHFTALLHFHADLQLVAAGCALQQH